jgi:hypothetical protein
MTTKEKIDKILDDAVIELIGCGYWITNKIELINRINDLIEDSIIKFKSIKELTDETGPPK